VNRLENKDLTKILFDLKYEDILRLVDLDRERKISAFFLKYNLAYLPTYLVNVSRNTFVIEENTTRGLKISTCRRRKDSTT